MMLLIPSEKWIPIREEIIREQDLQKSLLVLMNYNEYSVDFIRELISLKQTQVKDFEQYLINRISILSQNPTACFGFNTERFNRNIIKYVKYVTGNLELKESINVLEQYANIKPSFDLIDLQLNHK